MTITSLPENLKPKNLMSEEESTKLAEGVKQLMERIEQEKQDLSAQEYKLDGTNKITFPGYPYKFEACAKKIIVSIDVFKSGYECKSCKGRGKIHTVCSCEQNGHAGLKYGPEEIKSLYESKALPDSVVAAREALPCPDCKGDFTTKRTLTPCTVCKGIGASVILPDTSKNLPTTGVVLSIGPGVKRSKDDPKRTKYGYAIGDRVMFGPHSGTMVPTKFGLMFKILDASQAWANIEGAEDLGAFDFIMQE